MQQSEESGDQQENLLTSEDRRDILEEYVVDALEKGWRVESQGNFHAVIIEGSKVNNVLHAILSLITGGGWLLVWLVVSITGGEKRMLVEVDEKGTGRLSKL